MSNFSQCQECGHNLGHVALFCARCGRPSCCLDCHLRHTSRHAGEAQGRDRQAEGGHEMSRRRT
jgi:hypothetical protein